MSTLIVAVLFGLGFAYFAIQNTTGVSMQFGSYLIPSVPLYMIALGALLIGLLLAWVFHLIHSTAFALTIFGKNNEIKATQKTVAQLEMKISELELENTQLKAERPDKITVETPKQTTSTLMTRLKHSLST